MYLGRQGIANGAGFIACAVFHFSDLTTRVFLTNPADLVGLARSRLTRGLTEDECRQYLRRESCP